MFNSKSTGQTFFKFFLIFGMAILAVQLVSAQINLGGITIPRPKRQPKEPKTESQPENKTETKTTTKTTTSGNKTNDAPTDVQTNPEAPADYNANLNVGDQAVAIDHFRDEAGVKILAKTATAYKVAKLDEPDSISWYSLNSVYPYYDRKAFGDAMYTYKNYLNPYLSCYAKKHNLDEGAVKGNGFFGQSSFSNADDARKSLQADQPKLAEFDNLLKSKLGNPSNNFLSYGENPAVAAEIAANRADYLNCAVGAVASKPDFRLPIFLDDISKAKEEVDRYTPADFLYLVSAGDHSDELIRAVSKRAREEWAKEWLKDPASRAEFDKAWDELAASAAKKIPLYKPSADTFKFHYLPGEKLLTDYFKNRPTMKVIRIGTDTAGWDIQKDGSGFPSYRYKDVSVYFRDSNDDHPYCHVVSARVKQDYAGGGTYNSNIYRSSVSDEIFGCP